MIFHINVNYNISKKPITNGTRKSYIRHERRQYNQYRNKGINTKFSKYNAYYNLLDYSKIMRKNLIPYIRHHNKLKSVKAKPSRKIKSVHDLLKKRGTKIPYKFIVLKMGTGDTKRQLIKLFKANGYNYKDYTNAVNKAFYNYGINYNKCNKFIHYDHLDTNTDEAYHNGKFYGADHCHLGAIATAKTASGKVSLSFDRATKCQYHGHTNKDSWIIMQNQESHRFLHYATQSFQRYLGKGFRFQLTRRPSRHEHLTHDEYVQLKQSNDRLKKVLKSVSKQADGLSKDNNKYIEIIEKLENWKRRAIKILRMAYTGASIAKSLERKAKAYQKLSPKIIRLATALNKLPKSYLSNLQDLSNKSDITLIKSVEAYLETVK